jgi:hypothetical protein
MPFIGRNHACRALPTGCFIKDDASFFYGERLCAFLISDAFSPIRYRGNHVSRWEYRMGKIRSTLDIVMERTRGMSMSREDRDRLREKELSDTARAWVQKYIDGRMTWEEVVTRLDAAGEDKPLLSTLLKAEIASDIRPGGDNARLVNALDRLGRAGLDRITTIIGDHEQALNSRMDRHLELLRTRLEDEGIRGTSVIPNAARDPSWQNIAREVQEHLTAELRALS